MGSSMSCVPQHNFTFSSKSFIRRNSSRLFRKNNPQEGQEKSNSIINILCTVTPRKEMTHKDLQKIENIKWDPPFPYDPASGWKKSSINVKNYGRMVHSSKVRFRFLHCQDVHDCFLDLFQTHLHFVSNNTTGLTYQGTLPLKELTICNLQQNCNHSQPQEFAFQINGVSLNPIVVYCSNQKEMDLWFGLLKEHIEINGGTPITSMEAFARLKNLEEGREGKDELRNSISKEPIYEWEGSQRESLGPIVYVTKVLLQHLPCQEQSDRLLVMYPSTLIILSEESHGLFYKGKLPLNMITVTTPCQEVKANTFKIEGKLINPIVVTCLDKKEFYDWIQHFKDFDVPVLSPPPPVYDIIYTPTPREYTSSRPSSTETAWLGSRNNSMSSHAARPERDLRPLSMRYSSPQHCSYLPPEGPEGVVLYPVYNTPYSGQHCDTASTPQRLEKATLIKSSSWSTPETYSSLSKPQRHSDLCAPRQPLSPLYDEPCTPGPYRHEEENRSRQQPTMQGWRGQPQKQQDPHLLPSSFQLNAPPPGKRSQKSLVLCRGQGVEREDSESPAEQRAEAVSRLRLLPDPKSNQEERLFQLMATMNNPKNLYGYSPDHNSYLQPCEPDDQEIDYDNIW
ncbi:pleckstrin homology domain-containing family N member 1 isoform X2 [Esox lucius]|uniref:pleckstrin homology domain-containing family N member 1 isoform X2 n=1 Tax=Esox lucius TaxID=8010 RepID=UPI0009734C04|nr:pleckstrin homology domain-containing family N member 1 isoform X2 [Esox lucius]